MSVVLRNAMIAIISLPSIVFLFSPALSAPQRLPESAWTQYSGIRTEAHVLKQSSCDADGIDIYRIDFDLEILVTNQSERTVYVRSDMVQRFDRVAPNLQAANQGKYEQELGGGVTVWSADQQFPPVHETRILPGRAAILRVGGYVLSSYKSDHLVPGTISPGHHAIQFMLQPEKSFPIFRHVDIKYLIVGPIEFEANEGVHPESCQVK
jgi:hypothetical protein